MATIQQYIQYLSLTGSGQLFDEDCQSNWRHIAAQYGEVVSRETIAEVNLSQRQKECDYSIRVDTGKKPVGEIWYELDHEKCSSDYIDACYFVDASAVHSGADNSWVFEDELPRFLSADEVGRLKPNLMRCINLLPEGCRLFQLGVMVGRGDSRVRLFTDSLPPDLVRQYLTDVNWPGDLPALTALLSELVPFTDDGCFLIDFDVSEETVSEKLGINFGTGTAHEAIEEFLNYLSSKGLCLPEKCAGVLQWVKTPPQAQPFIQNDISHFKLPFIAGEVKSAKAYLRQGDEQRRAASYYHRPVLMNLELTSRCPLRCPQCYCDLETGRDMPLETALAWVRKAGASGVRTVNLSGGETLCYPHLYSVALEAAHCCGDVNVALSGAGFDKDALDSLKQAGVAGIYISLNGSLPEINACSRDGYALAIKALELLLQEGFGHVGINWVMHSTNADDFAGMLRLAERYGVHELAVMMFKPNAKHQLPTVPTLAQMQTVAKAIKAYSGPVNIQIEECFSQMKALINQKFFGNLNNGIEKGCGAGRDAFSVTLDGELTPCRHLDYPEKWDTVDAYWENSSVLKRLRCYDEEPEAPCNACKYKRYCRPCAAVTDKLCGKLIMGDETCPLAPLQEA